MKGLVGTSNNFFYFNSRCRFFIDECCFLFKKVLTMPNFVFFKDKTVPVAQIYKLCNYTKGKKHK